MPIVFHTAFFQMQTLRTTVRFKQLAVSFTTVNLVQGTFHPFTV
jgi:hypothetical protein